MNETIIICESLWDVITNRAVGVKNVIAAMGHEFTAYQAKTISQLLKPPTFALLLTVLPVHK